MKQCIYCGKEKPAKEFSDEHIWPQSLGGDFLPDFWRTEDVCGICNNMSGVFVDGAFIKSFFVMAERTSDALDYLDPEKPTGILPLNYLGIIQNIATQKDEVADYWVCAPGANVIHFRKSSEDDTWDTYAGGDPRRQSKKSKAGRVLVSFTSPEPYWVLTALSSVKRHFAKAEKFVTNLELPPSAHHFQELDPTDPQHALDLRFLSEFKANSIKGEWLKNRVVVATDAGGRFLAKLALAIGYKLFGTQFLETHCALNLRKAFREKNPEIRRLIPIRGSHYLNAIDLEGIKENMRWPGGWVLLLLRVSSALILAVQPPSGRFMVIQITDDPDLLGTLDPEYRNGVVWLTVPAAARALGPLDYPTFLAHQLGQLTNPELNGLSALRGQQDQLPPTGISDPAGSVES